jgi:hypothetical protein
MSDMDRIKQEIADNERWFESVCSRDVRLDTSRVRQAVGVAIQEQWLAQSDASTMPGPAISRIKSAVRAELARAGRKRRPWRWAAGSLSAAAMIAVAVFTAQQPVEMQPGNLGTVNNAGSVSLVAAFGILDEWDNALDAEISSLREALGAVDGSTTAADESDDWDSDWESWGADGSSGT